MTTATEAWERRGGRIPLAGHEVFVVDLDPVGEPEREPLLVIHGFPTSSFDFHLVADRLADHRRVVLVDLVGFGLSAKPDLAYTVDLQADVVVALTERLGVERLSLLTHDFGDTVGGELLARHDEGRWPVEIVRRVLTNGSIYIAMARLSAGQQLLLDLPDQRLPDDAPLNVDSLAAGLRETSARRRWSPSRRRPGSASWWSGGAASTYYPAPSATSRSVVVARTGSPVPSRSTSRRCGWCGGPTTPSRCCP